MDVNNQFYKQIVQKSAIGYAYHKIICNSLGEPYDYEYLDINTAFEVLTGLRGEDMVGKRVSEILPDIKKDSFDWIALYGDVALNGVRKEFSQYSASLKRWYKVNVYSPQRGYFITLFSDISEQTKKIEGYDSLISSLNDIVFVLDENLSFINVFVADDNILFMPKETFMFKKFYDVWEEQTVLQFEEAFKKALRTSENVVFEYKSPSPDDNRWFHAKVVFKKNSIQKNRFYIVLSDITKQKIAEEYLSRRVEYERLLNNISYLAVKIESIGGFLQDSLNLMGDTLKVSRIYIFEHRHLNDSMDNTYEWVAEGISPEKDNLQNIPAAEFLWWVERTKANKIIKYKDIEDIPDESTKEILRLQDIKSILIVPLFVNNEYYGFIGFDECKRQREWPQEDVDLLMSISRIITQGIMRKKTEEELEKERIQLISLFDSINEYIYVIDMDSYRILYANQNTEKVFGKKLIGEICYMSLQGKEAPCEFCNNRVIKKLNYQPYQWEYYNPVIKKHFQIMDRIIKWSDGRDVRLEMAVDITRRKRMEEYLHNEKEQLRVTLHSIGDGVITTDNKGKVVMLNKIAEELTGWYQSDAVGKPLINVFNIINEKTRKQCNNPVEQVLETGKILGLANHTILIAKNGIERAIADSAAPIMDQNGNIKGVVLVFRDVTEERDQEEKIIYLSYHDGLTGLYNRSYFEEELNRLDVEEQMPISLIMGDVNGLKIINDVFGHQKGDQLLQKISDLLRKTCRNQDVIARWGGDEFVILLPQTSESMASEICESITRACNNTIHENNHLSISLGYATKKVVKEDIQQVLKRAEDYMYKRKLLESKSLRSSIISSMKKTLAEKSYETEEHAVRLSTLCKKIGTFMALSRDELNELELLSMLHDIGKIVIKDSILTKPGKLTEEEWREMKKHPEIGYRIAQSVPELSQIAECILYHHERWDGSGYPQGLKGKEIPLLARILAVVDAYDAMTNKRPYRKALSKLEAEQELLNNAGTQFDSNIVSIFLENVID